MFVYLEGGSGLHDGIPTRHLSGMLRRDHCSGDLPILRDTSEGQAAGGGGVKIQRTWCVLKKLN